jgi:DNA processing protein
MEDHTLYQLALARIHGIGPAYTKKLIKHFGDAASIFHAGRSELERTPLPHHLIDAILGFSGYPRLRNELRHLHQLGARTLFFTDPGYPHRLLPFSNAPALLFYQGTADLNAAKIIAVAGTRQPTEYGRQTTAKLIRELARPGLVILSGLAFGIDAVAHHTAIKCHLPTIGVLGHGLDHLYPAQHRGLSRDMRRQGGLLTSFFHEKGPESHTFPVRNRLIAALCDALLVIESSLDGGSLSAVAAALACQKKIFALPGRITDEKSQGCLRLIHEQKAIPLLSADQLKAAMTWDWPTGHLSHQPALPFSPTEQTNPELHHSEHDHPELLQSAQPSSQQPHPNLAHPNPKTIGHHPDTETAGHHPALETQLINLLTEKQPRSFEDLITLTHQPIPSISIALLNLEIKGIIRSLPGRRYRLAC